MLTLPRIRIPAVIPVFRVARTSAKMKTALLFAIFALAYFAVVSDPANAQGISSSTPTKRPGAAAARPAAPAGGGAGAISSNPNINVKDIVVDANSLKVRVDELERRVLELEKEKARSIERDRAHAATNTKLEQRLAAVESALRDDGKGDKAAQLPASSKSPDPQTVRAPFRVVDEGGRVVMRVDVNSGRPRLTLGDPASGGLYLGVGESGAGFAVVRTATGTDGVALGAYRGGGMGVRVVGADGQTIEGALEYSRDRGRLTVGNPQKGGVSMSVGNSGVGYMVLRRPNGEEGIAMGQLNGRPLAIGLFNENGKELVTLGTGQTGGSVKVSTAAGIPVAALLSGETGGGVALTGPAGGKSAVSLTVEPNGGRVRVFPQDGSSTRAELFAGKSGGEVNVYNRAGEAVIWLEGTSQDQGRLQVGRAGKVYVTAGVVPSGVGIVATGPQVGGPPAGLVIPNMLRGRTGGK